jgi:hypothetical protein
MAGVDISEDDLKDWAKSLSTAAAVLDEQPASRAAISKREAAKLGVAAVYPNALPESVSNPILCRKVGAWLKVNFKELGEISDDTIERAAGRKT